MPKKNRYHWVDRVDDFIEEVHETARHTGWWAGEISHIAYKLERLHRELSELAEVFVRGEDGQPDKHCPQHSKAEIEWSDCILRLLDIGGRYGFKFAAIAAKHEYNLTRPPMHGGKKW